VRRLIFASTCALIALSACTSEPAPSKPAPEAPDPLVSAVASQTGSSSGSLIGYEAVFYRSFSPDKASLARFIVLKDGRIFILNPASPPSPPETPGPARLGPEPSSERADRERVLAGLSSKVSAAHKDLVGVQPQVEWYVVRLEGSEAASPTVLASPDATVVRPFSIPTDQVGSHRQLWVPWP
jgi:hypothetical protein